jgi:hypothetical protein
MTLRPRPTSSRVPTVLKGSQDGAHGLTLTIASPLDCCQRMSFISNEDKRTYRNDPKGRHYCIWVPLTPLPLSLALSWGARKINLLGLVAPVERLSIQRARVIRSQDNMEANATATI